VESEQLESLPARPGVYLFKDGQGNLIYVGKAANLRSRVRSYFSPSSSTSLRTRRMVRQIEDLELFVTGSEQEALILECNLIKRYLPRYNVHLKDNKSFPYLKIDVHDDWPRVQITRQVEQDGARYFGPFASAGSIRRSLRLIKRLFPFRNCSRRIDGSEIRPCLDYYIHRCLGPCTGAVDKREYREVIDQVILFLQGRQELVLSELKAGMKDAARRMKYERAAQLRDQVRAIEEVIEGQRIALAVQGDQDVIAVAQDDEQAHVEVFFVRNDRLIGRDRFVMEGISDHSPGEILTGFVKQYYSSASYIPRQILLQHPVDEEEVLSQWLSQQRGGRVRLRVPRRGPKKRLIDTVTENAVRSFEMARARDMRAETIKAGLRELKEVLRLPGMPLRIECYDVSNIKGRSATGSMVVLEKGLPRPAHYRRFRIRTVDGADDCAMIKETLRRRFGSAAGHGGTWVIMPDLVLIDGGRGQLNAALEVMGELGLGSIPVAGLAKSKEEIFVSGRVEPIRMEKDSAALHLLQRARDEAHRFAVSYHRRLRGREAFASAMNGIAGIGPKRKKALLARFGSVEAIRRASPDELATTEGITPALARRIKEYLGE